MSQYAPLILTGPARSGTTLLCQMLSAHPQMEVASDPYLPLFRAFRNAWMAQQAPGAQASFNPASPFQDYYFSQQRLAEMDCLQQSHLGIPCAEKEWPGLEAALQDRIRLQSPDLAPGVPSLRAGTYQEVFERAFALIARGRGAEGKDWVGFKDVWIVEFLQPLLHCFPRAKAVILLRDPRAILASLLGLAKRDPTQMAHPLSYLRHWRKYLAFALHYQSLPWGRERLLVLNYERLIQEPEATLGVLCAFLGVPFHADMLDPSKYYDHAAGAPWQGNSSFKPALSSLDRSLLERWRQTLEPAYLELAEWSCWADMALAGYAPQQPLQAACQSTAVLQHLLSAQDGPYSWRSDQGDALLDYGCELLRHHLLLAQPDLTDLSLLRRAFLFVTVYTQLRNHLKGNLA